MSYVSFLIYNVQNICCFKKGYELVNFLLNLYRILKAMRSIVYSHFLNLEHSISNVFTIVICF